MTPAAWSSNRPRRRFFNDGAQLKCAGGWSLPEAGAMWVQLPRLNWGAGPGPRVRVPAAHLCLNLRSAAA